ncbi:MAG TPA: glycosyltransferase family 39 protein [Pyrinomonadaceae bacterium]|jgi:4-amino-4-deoxy-L-arabinose transferase-like glycosyltransferase
MTFPHGRADAEPAAEKPRTKKLQSLLLPAIIFALLFLLHLPLLGLPYYWDEAGYFVPAARDIYLTGDPVPRSTLSNAHPPLVMYYLALCWRLFGEGIQTTRTGMLFVASLTLLGLFRLARRVASREVALATVVCTALYPVFFSQSSLAHLDMTVAALTIWGLFFYLPEREDGEGEAISSGSATTRANARRAASFALFALAALAKETAILTPMALMSWEIFCWWMGRRREGASSFCITPRRSLLSALGFLLTLVPLALWFAYHYRRTGYVLGNPEYFRYNVESTLNLARILQAGLGRLWHVTGYMNLFLLTGAAALSMLLAPLRDAGVERKRIDVSVQLVFAVLILAHAAALSVVGGAVLARYMLPVLPLLILLCVSTVRRRVRHWRLLLGVVCVGFVLALFVNPPVRFPWEDNLAYRDFILLHERAGKFLSEKYPNARVLTAWPATDELKNPYYGYTTRPLNVVGIEHFSGEQLSKALGDPAPFDVALLFSTNYPEDLSPEEAARLLGGRIVYRESRRGHWVAVVEMERTVSSER